MVDEADPVTGETALSAACASARKETVGYLLNRAGARAAYGRQSEKPTPPLLQAVANGCWEIVSTLLARQMDVDGERNGTGQTALMIAAQHGHIAVLELLLSRSKTLLFSILLIVNLVSLSDVDVSATDDDGRTALYWACLKDQPAVANLLLDRGASLDLFDKHDFGPIHYAAQHGSKQLVSSRCSTFGGYSGESHLKGSWPSVSLYAESGHNPGLLRFRCNSYWIDVHIYSKRQRIPAVAFVHWTSPFWPTMWNRCNDV